MTEKEIKKLEKEIIRQMGVKDIDKAKQDDWDKVDPELRDKYISFVADRLSKTMKNLSGQENGSQSNG